MNTILVIDDEPIYRSTLSRLLQHEGYEVIEAEDGLSGVKLARSEQPDLVLCDLGMEPMDGFMVLSIMRGFPGTAQIPFIIVSGLDEKENIRRSLGLGADDFIIKPFSPKDITESIARWLKKREELVEQADERIDKLKARIGSPLPVGIMRALDGVRGIAVELREGGARNLAPDRAYQLEWHGQTLEYGVRSIDVLNQIHVVSECPEALGLLRRSGGNSESTVILESAWKVFKNLGTERGHELNLCEAAIAVDPVFLGFMVEYAVFYQLQMNWPGGRVRIISNLIGKEVLLSIEAVTNDEGESDTLAVDIGASESSLVLRAVSMLAALFEGKVMVKPGPGGMQLQILLPENTTKHRRLKY